MHKSLFLFLLLFVSAGMINLYIWDENSDDNIRFTITGENLSLEGCAEMNGTYSAMFLNNVTTMDEYIMYSHKGHYATATENLTN